MRKKEYKIELYRPNKPLYMAAEDLESFINSYAKQGWVVKSMLFHSDIITYEIMFERSYEVKNNG